MSISYTHYVFQTLTYNREDTCKHRCWWRVSRDTTAYIQSIRRRFVPLGPVEFLKVVERHEDYYPHVHLLLHFHGALRVDNEKYFDRKFYSMVQSLWRRGFSKPEVLRNVGDSFSYTLKYFFKQIRDKTDSGGFGSSSGSESLPPKIWPLKGKRVTYFGMPIRLLAWSRGMQYLYALQQKEQLKSKGFNLDLPDKLVLPKIAKQGTLLTKNK